MRAWAGGTTVYRSPRGDIQVVAGHEYGSLLVTQRVGGYETTVLLDPFDVRDLLLGLRGFALDLPAGWPIGPAER